MRIAVISTPVFKLGATGLTGYGGLEQLAWQRAKGLAERGHDVKLFAPDGSECPGVRVVPIGPAGQCDEAMAYGGFPEVKEKIKVQEGGAEVEREILRRRSHAGYCQELLDVDCIIDDSWGKYCWSLKAEGKIKCPILAVCHAPVDTMFSTLPPPGLLSFVCISKDQAAHFEALFSRPAMVAYNGVDVDDYKPLGIPRSGRFLFLARFSTVKGPDLAIEACRKAGVGLDLVGDTKLTGEPEYLRSILYLADGKQIRFVGPATRPECVWWFSQAHCLVHANQRFREPFGLAPVEAQLCGCPVIAFDYGAMRETVNDGRTGRIVKSMDELVQTIRYSAFADPVFGNKAADVWRGECREWVSQFSYEAMISRYDELCRMAVDGEVW